MQDPSHYIVPIALFAFIIFSKVKRSINFQKFVAWTMILRIVVFSLLAIMLFWIASMHPITFLMDLVGVAIGLPLLYFAAKHSVFEWRGDDVFYKTHIWIEILVLILFFFRFFYRFFYQGNAFQTAHTPEEVQQQLKILYDPFMSIVIFLVCTYYVGYAIFLLKKVSGLRMGHEARRFN